MRIFVPYPSLTRSAECLTHADLAEMRSNVLIAIRDLWERAALGVDAHPGRFGWDVDRWLGHEGALVQYARALDAEWRRRRNPQGADAWTVRQWLDAYRGYFHASTWEMPPWLGDPDLHASERSSLRDRDAVAYGSLSEITAAGRKPSDFARIAGRSRR